ncbi:hypothetical protein [Candidatus Contubernalis alkaliaceticus]|uniref:hypothetical protein n=1 Tax=Candidatus Contubernalis alkaliaceticus TaxID=338645 RepID=UPI001F4BE1E9|nr:hypothetical protein [Candidatus Contubernalis alkalaceticus]UNC91097.1 hypothetical protein HUE98_02745 [Candidatus Contubernalis alkalaceticus]
MNRNILKVICLLVLIFFVFPFFTVSCGRQEIATLSGLNLVTGTTVRGDRVDASPFMIIVFLLAAVAFVSSLVNTHKALLAPAALGAVNLILLLVFKLHQTLMSRAFM